MKHSDSIQSTDARNVRVIVLTEADLDARLEAAAERGAARAIARMQSDVCTTGLLSARELAKTIGCSATQVQKLTAAGMPVVMVGTRRRYDVQTCRDWLASRNGEPLPVPPKKTGIEDPIDVSRAMAKSGLRRVAR